jgi:hypothetical protein
VTKAHIEVQITMSLEEALALEQHLSGGVMNTQIVALRMALSKQLGLAERALAVVA